MGTIVIRNPNIKGLPGSLTFLNSSNSFTFLIVMSTVFFAYGYNHDIYYLFF